MYTCSVYVQFLNFEDVTNPAFSQFVFEGHQPFKFFKRFCECYLPACCTCDIANGIILYFKQNLIKKST